LHVFEDITEDIEGRAAGGRPDDFYTTGSEKKGGEEKTVAAT
jgi:hypothetical protein